MGQILSGSKSDYRIADIFVVKTLERHVRDTLTVSILLTAKKRDNLFVSSLLILKVLHRYSHANVTTTPMYVAKVGTSSLDQPLGRYLLLNFSKTPVK